MVKQPKMKTKGRTLLLAWIADDPGNRTQSEIARRLKVKQPSVNAWVAGYAVPNALHRAGLEALTDIPATFWRTARETELLRSVTGGGA
jgi:transcriptional regulator with XRE-family HTH domain